MNLPFIKYQSLGNDFILFKNADLVALYGEVFLLSKSFQQQVSTWCNRYFGIGADGVLVVSDNPENPSVTIFNADGSKGQFSGNGVRCAAHYFQQHYNLNNSFDILMGGRTVYCSLDIKNNIVTKLPSGRYQGPHEAVIKNKLFKGDWCDVGNPHFLLEASKALLTGDLEVDGKVIKQMLHEVGYDLVTHQGMDRQVNVEFYWEVTPLQYMLIPFERGAGLTLACSSGAAALAWTLHTKKILLLNQDLNVMMEGGSVIIKIDGDYNICLSAQAKLVFKGVC